jgi:hypothetical protein
VKKKKKATTGTDDYVKAGGRLKDLPYIPESLLGRAPVHPRLHADGRGVILGRVDEDMRCEMVTSDRARFPTAAFPKGMLVTRAHPYPDLRGRWATADVERWQQGDATPPLAELIAGLRLAYEAFLELPRPELSTLLAIFTVATYFHQDFLTLPRLAFSGERGSGKSKAETLIAALAWNGVLLVSPTVAVIFRMIATYRPTMVLDELEGLGKDDRQEILAVINSGYKRGAHVPRVEGKEERRIEPFDVYGPMTLSAIRALPWVVEDRAIPIVMQRGTSPAKINREVDPANDGLAELRAVCHRQLLTAWPRVRQAYRSVTCPDWLRGRPLELWRALLAIADAADDAGSREALLAVARDHVIDRHELSPEAEAILATLGERLLGLAELTICPGDVAAESKTRLGWRDAPTPELIASWFRRLGFRRQKQTKRGSEYRITADSLAKVAERHAPPETATLPPLPLKSAES